MNPIEKALAQADRIVAANGALEATTRHAKCDLRWSAGRANGFATKSGALNLIKRDSDWAKSGGAWLEHLVVDGRHHVALHNCEQPAVRPARSYVIGLPVVITVHDDGTVTAEVDLSEASDLTDSSVSVDQTLEALPEAEREAIIEADIVLVEDAVVQALVKVSA